MLHTIKPKGGFGDKREELNHYEAPAGQIQK